MSQISKAKPAIVLRFHRPTSPLVAIATFLLALSVSAEAQQPNKLPRIGFLALSASSTISARVEAFRQGLRELGYIEGKNIVVEYWYADEKLGRLPELAAELVRPRVNVLVTGGEA
jgi:putative ABC transport system substrate-binding protein